MTKTLAEMRIKVIEKATKLVAKSRATDSPDERLALLTKAQELIGPLGMKLTDLAITLIVKKAETAVIAALLDESQSMESVRDATIMGFNSFVTTLQRELIAVPAFFSAFLFDSRQPILRPLQEGVPMAMAVRLHRGNYRPEGMTPLYDAIANTLLATDRVVAERGATRTTVVIQTDGQENVSRGFSLPTVKHMVGERKERGWQIIFLGADLPQTYDIGALLGVDAAQTMSYNKQFTDRAFSSLAQNSACYSIGTSASVSFSSTDKRSVGDETAGRLRGPNV